MGPITRAKRWWQEYTGEEDTPFDGDTPAWLVSLLIHVIVLLSLALVALLTIAVGLAAPFVVVSGAHAAAQPHGSTDL